MKIQLGCLVGIVIAFFFLSPAANSQVPSSIAGDGFLMSISSGTYPFGSFGYYLFIPDNTGSTFQNIGIYNISSFNGSCTYTPTSSSQATLSINSGGGLGTLDVSFSTASSGSFYATANSVPGSYQNGSFGFASINAPGSVAGKTILLTVSDGLYPFAYSGSARFVTDASGNTYSLIGSGNVASSSGTYSYSIVNRSTAALQVNDSVSGSSTVYVGFSAPLTGGYAIKAASGFQIGSFAILDTTAPTVAITAPTAGLQWNSSSFTVTGTAGDDVQVAGVYYQVNGGSWTMAGTGNNWANWSGNASLTSGANTIRAYSVDSSGNSSSFTSVTFNYVVVTAPSISTQPKNQTVPPGTSVAFTVGATGTPTLTYQWVFDGTNISGATQSSLNIGNAQLANAGTYMVSISNGSTPATSLPAILSLIPPVNTAGCATAPTGMVGWWSGDGSAADIQGSSNGSMQGGATFGTAEVGQGFNLNGTTAYVQISNSPSLALSAQMTAVAWIRPTAWGIYNQFLDKHTSGQSDGFVFSATNGLVRLRVGANYVNGATTLPLNTFSLVSGTFDGTTIRVYVNGVLDGSLTAASGIPVNSLPMILGGSAANINYFAGVIDEVMLFNRALTATELQSIYNAGTAGLCKGEGFSSIVKTGGNQIQLNLHGKSGSKLRIDSTSNFTDWTALATVTNTSGSVQCTDSSTANTPRRYYRATSVP